MIFILDLLIRLIRAIRVQKRQKEHPLSMLITKFFDHYFQFILRFYIQG